ENADVQLNIVAPKQVQINEPFEIRLDLVNIGRSTAMLTKIVGVCLSKFETMCSTSFCSKRNTDLEIENKTVSAFDVETIHLSSHVTKPGTYTLNPEIIYTNKLGETRTSKTKPLIITVEEFKPKFKVLPGRISTGNLELDELLYGGIPNEYAVVLTGSPSEVREDLIRNFLKVGTDKKETVFYIASEADDLDHFFENPNSFLFLCNPKPKTQVNNIPNVYKLRSKTDLTNLSISLAKAYRKINPSKKKRICIETVSDVLLDYGAKATRKWISELIADLESKGFTTLAVLNPAMHPSDQATAITDLFDGEISILRSSDPLDCKKSIVVKKLRNQDYNKNPICLI
ncbi:MAG: ATPase domain-containing protein, partial [Candidatus Bathyarchaeota archaeon]